MATKPLASLLVSCRSSASDEQVARLLNPDLLLQTLLSWQDIRGVTPLMLASRGGHVGCLRLLLQHGADPLLLDSVNRRCVWGAEAGGQQGSGAGRVRRSSGTSDKSGNVPLVLNAAGTQTLHAAMDRLQL